MPCRPDAGTASAHDARSGDVAIIADDLTGACDAAIPFRARGASAVVGINAFPSTTAAVAAVTSETRSAEPAEAERRVRALVASAHTRGASIVLKKVDSQLRGNVGRELAAALTAARAPFAVLAPALPRLRRTVRDGVLRMPEGRPLSLAELVADGGGRLTAERVSATADAAALERAITAAGASADVVLCDCDTDKHLLAVAHAVLRLSPRPVLAGSSGLAAQLAAATLTDAPAPSPLAGAAERVLLVLGSLNAVLRGQLERLLVERPVSCLPLAEAETAGAEFVAEQSLVVESVRGPATEPDGGETARRLGEAAATLLASGQFDAVVCSGGAVAAALCSTLGDSCLDLLYELTPGAVVARTCSVPILVLRSGGFGDDGDLVEIYDALTSRTG